VEQYKLDTFFLEVAIILVQGSSHSRLVQKQDCNYEKMNHLSDFSNFLGHTNQHWMQASRLHILWRFNCITWAVKLFKLH